MPLKDLAVNKSCSMKKVFLKISQNSLENTRLKVSFLTKLQEHFFLQNASVSVKRKYMKCDHSTFMNRELSKSIVLRTKMRTGFPESRLKKTKQIAESKWICVFRIRCLWKDRSSRPEVFCKRGALRNFSNSQENTCVRVSFLIKLQASMLWRKNNIK